MLIIVGGLSYHIYTDGKWITPLMGYKKQAQIAGIVLTGLFIYWLFKYEPSRVQKLLVNSKDYVKYMPIDSAATSFLTPVLDFSNKWYSTSGIGGGGGGGRESASITKIMNSGGNTSKRSVSESKKKFKAAEQNWKCFDCKQQLDGLFEVDHVIPLHKGGTNSFDNLQALCVRCHKLRTVSDKLYN
jgi:hypothetical protein